MLLSNAPRKVALPFAENGEKNTIPEGSSPSAGFASMNDGFPPLTRQPVGSGGIPPQGLDMNGILYYLSSLNKWQSAGGSFVYDSTFATDSDVGGYPKGAILLRSDGNGFWLNRVDNNTTNPDTGGANWQPINNVGITSKTLTGSDVTLTNAEASKDIIVLSGTLTANVNLIMPVFVKQWIVANNTSGAFTVTVKTASGTGGVVTQSTSRVFYGDGTNIYGVNPLIASQEQVNTGTDNSTFLTPKTFKDSQLLADKADKNGNTSNRFKVATPVDSDEAVQKNQLDALSNLFTGTCFPHVGTAVPTGFLLCNGAAVNRTTYAALFAVIGTIWGVGDGSTTFNLPDGRGKAFLGADAGKSDDPTLTVGSYIAQQGGVKTIVTSTGGSPATAPATITVPQDGATSALFTTGDAVSGTDQSMTVANTNFVYPRSFVGQWIIKT